jgi:hypothetical protein
MVTRCGVTRTGDAKTARCAALWLVARLEGEIVAPGAGVCFKPVRNLSMLQVNPSGTLAVLGSDEHRKAGRDARRCDGREADGVMNYSEGMAPATHPQRGAAPNDFPRAFFSKYARGSQLVLSRP